MSSVFISAFWHLVVRGFKSGLGRESMVWYRICGSIAWVGASLDVGLDGFCASMVSLSIWFHGRWSLAVKFESEILLFVATPRVSCLCCVSVFSPRLVWVVGLEINFSNHFVDCLDCFSRVETVFRYAVAGYSWLWCGFLILPLILVKHPSGILWLFSSLYLSLCFGGEGGLEV